MPFFILVTLKQQPKFLASRTKSISVPSITFNLRFNFRTSIAFIDMEYIVLCLCLVPLINEIKFAYQTSQFQYYYLAIPTF
jgi:hypothetical protein